MLTLYLRDAPDGTIARRILGFYYRFCPEERRCLVAGTRSPGFVKADAPIGERVLSEHLELMNRRRDEGISVWDGRSQESWSISIRGAGVVRGQPPRASFCQVIFPNDTPPALVADFATQLADSVDFVSGHGGLTALFSAEYKTLAFDQIYAWAKLYPGLEVDDLNATLEHVLDAIKGANWLTLVGIDLWSRLAQANGGKEPDFSDAINVRRARHGVLLIAGAAPELGKRNAARIPTAYVEVERALKPLKLRDHGELQGRFEQEGATRSWLYRFLEPDGW